MKADYILGLTLTQPAFLYPHSNHPGPFRPGFTTFIVIGTWMAIFPNTNNQVLKKPNYRYELVL